MDGVATHHGGDLMRPPELVASASCQLAASVVQPRSGAWREPY